MRHAAFLSVLACAPATGVLAGLIQNPSLVLPSDAAQHRQDVVDIFLSSYKAYKKYAWSHDDVTPVTKTYTDGRNGWGATIVDALTTLKIMGQEDLFTEAVNFASNIDFSISHTQDTVSVFETTIRYVGGLLSAYELSGSAYPVLVTKAKEVADKLTVAWVGSNKVPYGHLDFSSNSPQKSTSNIAEAGTLTLEWYTLSKYTQNDTYRQLAEGSVRQIIAQPDPLPGLAAQGIDPATGKSVGAYVTWGGGSDSYFEYLIKYPRLTNTNDSLFADTWATAVDSSIHTLAVTSTVGNHLYLADYTDDGQIRNIGSHLACFHAGNWLFGGRLLDNQTIIDYGLQLNDACWNTYAQTNTGIGPEAFGYFSNKGNYTGASVSDFLVSTYNQHGFFLYPGAEYYYLRPEVLESNFYAWRVTGDMKYLDRAAQAIKSFQSYLSAPAGYGGIWNVNNTERTPDVFIDDTESFWYAEVLKYLYLTFDDPMHINIDEWVFNTEAHPFKTPSAKAVYRSGKLSRSSPKVSPAKSGDLPQISYSPALRRQLKSILGL